MKKNKEFYLLAALLVIAVKYNATDVNTLKWLLAPTVWWVRSLSGISFEYISDIGYISHACQFIIAPSCSGLRFLILTFIMLVCTFLPQIDSYKNKMMWFVQSIALSYGSTIFVNGLRITLSIFLPPILEERNLLAGWLTPERFHTMLGTFIYFSSLFIICRLAANISFRKFSRVIGDKQQEKQNRILAPIFWYFLMVLGLPFLGRLCRNTWEGFFSYCILVTSVCGSVCIFLWVSSRLYLSIHRAKSF